MTEQNYPKPWEKSYPDWAELQPNIAPITIPQALERSAVDYADNVALLFMGQKITYQALNHLVNRFANALQSLGYGKDSRIALMLPNIPQMVIAHYAVLRLGGTCVMVNPLYTASELKYLLSDSNAEALIVLDALAGIGLKVRPETQLKDLIVCHLNDTNGVPADKLPPGTYTASPEGEKIYDFAQLMAESSNTQFSDQSAWEDLALLIYTGGTTGLSKGVMLYHDNISANVQQLKSYFQNEFTDGQERTLAIYPFFHVAGYSVVQNYCIWHGNTLALVPRPEPASILPLLEQVKPTIFQAVPTIFVGLLGNEQFQKMDLSFIKVIGTGAAPMSAATYEALKKLCPTAKITEGYGLTECAGMATATPATTRFKQGSVGMPMPGTEVRIVDLEKGEKDMPTSEAGEVLLKGAQVMKGYLNKAEQTAETLKDGWLHTGDIGYLDEEGWLFLIDRKKDMILASGYNIYPKEVDEVLFAHPEIAEACTVGVPDEYRGETVKVFVVKHPNSQLNADAVISHCRAHLAVYKVPKLVEFVEELPKSAVGKILRRELREMANTTK